MFFAVTHGKNTESALSLVNLLNMLSVKSVHQLQALKFAFRWHKKELTSSFQNYFQYGDQVRNYNTRYAPQKNCYKRRTRTKIGKQSIQSIAVDLGKDLHLHLKDLPNYSFPRLLKHHLLIDNSKVDHIHSFLSPYCWFSRDVSKIQTTKLSIPPRFYFHDVLEQLKNNHFHTNFPFKRVLGFVIEYT